MIDLDHGIFEGTPQTAYKWFSPFVRDALASRTRTRRRAIGAKGCPQQDCRNHGVSGVRIVNAHHERSLLRIFWDELLPRFRLGETGMQIRARAEDIVRTIVAAHDHSKALALVCDDCHKKHFRPEDSEPAFPTPEMLAAAGIEVTEEVRGRMDSGATQVPRIGTLGDRTLAILKQSPEKAFSAQQLARLLGVWVPGKSFDAGKHVNSIIYHLRKKGHRIEGQGDYRWLPSTGS